MPQHWHTSWLCPTWMDCITMSIASVARINIHRWCLPACKCMWCEPAADVRYACCDPAGVARWQQLLLLMRPYSTSPAATLQRKMRCSSRHSVRRSSASAAHSLHSSRRSWKQPYSSSWSRHRSQLLQDSSRYWLVLAAFSLTA